MYNWSTSWHTSRRYDTDCWRTCLHLPNTTATHIRRVQVCDLTDQRSLANLFATRAEDITTKLKRRRRKTVAGITCGVNNLQSFHCVSVYMQLDIAYAEHSDWSPPSCAFDSLIATYWRSVEISWIDCKGYRGTVYRVESLIRKHRRTVIVQPQFDVNSPRSVRVVLVVFYAILQWDLSFVVNKMNLLHVLIVRNVCTLWILNFSQPLLFSVLVFKRLRFIRTL